MKLEGIINVSGKPGLYKVISRNNNSIIIECLENKKREPLYSHVQATMLEEISIYTYEDTKPLSDILNLISKKEQGKETLSHKSSKEQLISFFREIMPDYDEERVYISDIKKVLQWYNILQKSGFIKNTTKKDNDENSN